MSKPVKCGRCGRENDPSFAFCLDCGGPLRPAPAPAPSTPPELLCAGCGARLQPGFRFCGHCGAPAGAPAPAPAAPRPVAVTPGPSHGTALHLSATGGSPMRLAAVRHDGLPGAVYALDQDEVICGRSEGTVRVADDPTVSPRHARFVRRGGAVRVEDLGSVNGTYLRLKGTHRLSLGEELRLGRQLLRLEPLPRPAGDDRAAHAWGSPDHGFTLRLAQLLEGGGLGEIFPLRSGENVVGREAGDVTFPADRYVSGRHARIDVGPEGASVTDLGSSNGTFVKVAGSTEVAAGDQLLIGAQLFRLDA